MAQPARAPDPPERRTPSAADWDRVEELAFQCLELRAADPAHAEARIGELLAPHPELRGPVHEVLQRIDDTNAAAAAPPLPAVPDRLGPFRLGRCLGQGGMGAVFEAHDATLGRTVAVKIVRPELLLFPEARQRFRREAEAIARLSHPGIVPIHQVGEDAGVPWFAMEFVAGRSLAAVLRDLHGRSPATLRGRDLQRAALGDTAASGSSAFSGDWEETCLRLVLELAQALAHAHDRGVLHRDVKPSNVLVAADGHPRLCDFGLARTGGGDELTRTGAAVGSVPYMAPEQLRGDAVDARADVYALGVLLHELLTLRSPFLRDHEAATRRAVELGEAPPLPRGLRWETTVVTAVAMDRDPERRYQGMHELAADLQRVLDRRPILARPPGLRRRLGRYAERHPVRATAAVAGAFAVLIGPLLYTLALQHERDLARSAFHEAERLREQDRQRSYRAGVQAAQLALRMGQATTAREQLERCPEELRAFEWHHLARQLDDSAASFATDTGFVRRVAFAPDGLLVAGADGAVRHWSADGELRRTFGPDSKAAALTMAASADGRIVLTGHVDHTARLWRGDDGGERAVVALGEHYGATPPQRHQQAVYAVALDAAAELAYAGSAGGLVAVIDLARGAVVRTFRLPVVRGGPFALAVAPDGGLLAAACDFEILLLTPDGEIRRTLRGHQGLVFSLRFSHDGARLLSASQDRTARVWQVADGSASTLLLGHDGEVHEAAWDGDERAWTASNDGTLRQWDVGSGRELQRRLGHRGSVYGVALREAPRALASAGWDGTARLWDPDTGAAKRRIGARARTARCLVLHGGTASGEPTRCSIVDDQHGVRTFGLPGGAPEPPLVAGPVRALAVRGDAVAHADGRAVQRGAAALAGAEDDVDALLLLADGTLVGAETGGALLVWPPGVATAERRTAHTAAVRALLALGDGFVSAALDGSAFWWRRDGSRTLLASGTQWEGAAAARGGETVYLCGMRRVVAVDAGSATPRWDRSFEAQMRGITTASQGRRLLVAGSDHALHVLDATDGTPIVALPAGNLVDDVVVADGVAVTATVYSEVDLWLGDTPR